MKTQTILRTDVQVHLAAEQIVKAANEDVLHIVEIKPYKKNRSVQQNRYYWKILDLMSQHFGHTSEELHEYFKGEFLEPKESIVMGVDVKMYATTTKLNTSQFNEYIERIALKAADMGYTVPPPLALGYEL